MSVKGVVVKKVAIEPMVPSDKVEVITSKVVWWSYDITLIIMIDHGYAEAWEWT